MSALDYITEAEQCMGDALGSPGVTETANLLALAQVNATLALAEQQRIANLLAYRRGLGQPIDLTDWSDEQRVELFAVARQTEAIVREGLGLS